LRLDWELLGICSKVCWLSPGLLIRLGKMVHYL
jgi:hypothetical protein